MNLNIFSTENIEAVRKGALSTAFSTASFGVQALKLLSEIRDNTGRIQREDRIYNRVFGPGISTFFTIPPGSQWTVNSILILGSNDLSVRRVLLNDSTIFASDTLVAVGGGGIPLAGGGVVTVESDPGVGEFEVTMLVSVPKVDRNKPGPWNVDYSSVDNVGAMSSIHLDSHFSVNDTGVSN